MLEHLTTRDATASEAANGNTTPAADQDGGAAEAGTACDTDPERIAATTRGAGFRLADCVDALCLSVLELAA